MPDNTVIAFIPARSGSKSMLDKNIHPLGGYPVLAWSIAAARMSKYIDRIIVSTDSEQYADIARSFGVEVPFLRPKEYAQDNSTDRECILHAAEWLKNEAAPMPEYWVHLRPTTPLRDPAIVDAGIEAMLNAPQATALRSAHCAPESPYKWFSMNEQGYFQGILHDPRPEYYNLPKQAFPNVYIPNGYVDVLKYSHFSASNTVHGNKMIGFTTPFCAEIDSKEEFELIEYRLNKIGCPLEDWLQKNNQ